MITFDSRILRRAKRSLLQIYLIKKQERKFKNANFKLFSEVSMFERNLKELIKFRGIDNSGVDNYGGFKGGILMRTTDSGTAVAYY